MNATVTQPDSASIGRRSDPRIGVSIFTSPYSSTPGFSRLAVNHLNPPPLDAPGDQVRHNSLEVFPLHHDLLQLRILWIGLDNCRRLARSLQSFGEAVCGQPESLETRYARNGAMVIGSDIDQNWDRFTLPRRL